MTDLVRGPNVFRTPKNEGDQELVEFSDRVLENNHRVAQRAKEILVPTLQGEQE